MPLLDKEKHLQASHQISNPHEPNLDSSSIHGLTFLEKRLPSAVYTPVSAGNIYAARTSTVERSAVDMQLDFQGNASSHFVEGSHLGSQTALPKAQYDKTKSVFAKSEQSKFRNDFFPNSYPVTDDNSSRSQLNCATTSPFSRISRSKKTPRGVLFLSC